MKNFFRKNYGIFISQVFIFIVSLLNRFPEGYFYSGWDFIYPLDLNKIIYTNSYVWNQSAIGSFLLSFGNRLYYEIILILSNLFRLNFSSQSFLYMFIFLFISYWSSFFSCVLFDTKKQITINQKNLISLIYTFNFYTYYVFYFQDGYSPFLFLYTLIPIIFALLFRLLSEEKNYLGYILISSIPLYLTNICNSNISFFISLNINTLFFIVTYIFIYKACFIKTLKKVIIYYFLYFLTVSWSVIPQINELLRGLSDISNDSSIYSLKDWIFTHAVKFPYVFSLSPPHSMYYDSPHTISRYFLYFSIFLVMFLLLALNKKIKKFNVLFLLLLLFNLSLLNRGMGIVNDNIIYYIFKSPILIPIRSFDKMLIFLPFFALFTLFGNVFSLEIKPLFKTLIILFVLTTQLIIASPLLFGQVNHKYSFLFNLETKENNNRYVPLHKIPQDYLNVSTLVNKDKENFRILSLPYSVKIPGYADYPKWGILANDPTEQLFNSPIISPNDYAADFLNWNYGLTWNKNDIKESVWLLSFSRLLNIKYIIYHKDVNNIFIKETSEKIDFYEKKDLIKSIYKGKYLNLYLNNSYLKDSKISIPKKIMITDLSINKYPNMLLNDENGAYYFNNQNLNKNNTKDIKTTVKNSSNNQEIIKYQYINPTNYQVKISNINSDFILIFNEKYNAGWKLFNQQNKQIVDNSSHFIINGFANSWIIKTKNVCKDYPCTVVINVRFDGQSLHDICYAISNITLTVSIVSFFIYFIIKRSAKIK